jgi:leucyl-tRNA synthetase
MILGRNPHYVGYAETEEEKQALIDHYGSEALRPSVKMSKSLGNVVNPDDVIREYGTDTMRVYIMFIGDFEKTATWSDEAVKGSKRFLDRCFNLLDLVKDDLSVTPANEALIHKTIKKVGDDILELKMNTAIAALMTLVNQFYANGCTKGDLKPFITLLSPFAPHLAEEMWEILGFSASEGKMAMQMSWPEYDESKTVDKKREMAVQVNGKLRSTIIVDSDADEDTVIQAALADEKIQRQMVGMELVKTIVVKNRIVNLILKKAN